MEMRCVVLGAPLGPRVLGRRSIQKRNPKEPRFTLVLTLRKSERKVGGGGQMGSALKNLV